MSEGDRHAWLTNAEFARCLITRAVTVERIEQALAGLTANALPFNSISAGLGGLARVTVSGVLGKPRVRPHLDRDDAFAVTIPATLDLAVRLGGDSHLGADVEVDLTLTPRPADPLLLVIDIAPVLTEHVRITTRAGGLGNSIAAFLPMVLDEIRKQTARSVSTLLHSGKVRSGRAIDVGARIDGRVAGPTPEAWAWLDDATFGDRFLRRAVTVERLTTGFANLAGLPLSIGPLAVGPRDMATVTAQGSVGMPTIAERDDSQLSFDAVVPIDLELTVAVGRENRYHAAIAVNLVPIVRAADPLVIVLDIAPITAEDVEVEVIAHGRIAGVLGRAGKLEQQLRAQVASTVNTRLADTTARTFDIGARIDGG